MSFLVALLILLALLLMLFLVMGPALAQAAAMSVPSTMILKTTPRTQPTQPATISPPSQPAQPAQPEVFEDEFIDLERIGGRVKASSVKTVEGLVQTHQQEALAVIRGWMAQNGY
ncbi:MAG: hypothetical protein HOI45_01225 [Rhodospirillaceae bacterium]|nr:hypothetical protein [Rhodospirillaceae bacterium]MBT6218325.1 hypothetical protein [Rhodospirillaceae bacterium]